MSVQHMTVKLCARVVTVNHYFSGFTDDLSEFIQIRIIRESFARLIRCQWAIIGFKFSAFNKIHIDFIQRSKFGKKRWIYLLPSVFFYTANRYIVTA